MNKHTYTVFEKFLYLKKRVQKCKYTINHIIQQYRTMSIMMNGNQNPQKEKTILPTEGHIWSLPWLKLNDIYWAPLLKVDKEVRSPRWIHCGHVAKFGRWCHTNRVLLFTRVGIPSCPEKEGSHVTSLFVKVTMGASTHHILINYWQQGSCHVS